MTTPPLSLMIDIETLSSEHDACIVSIGAVKFLRGGQISDPDAEVIKLATSGQFYRVLDLQTDRHVDPNTVMWWMIQADAARGAAFGPGDRTNIKRALRDLAEYAKDCESSWGHGATFDLMLLMDAYKQYTVKPPACLHYRQMRDTRTLFSLLPEDQRDAVWPTNPNKHHPVWDAATQAVAVGRAIRVACREQSDEMSRLTISDHVAEWTSWFLGIAGSFPSKMSAAKRIGEELDELLQDIRDGNDSHMGEELADVVASCFVTASVLGVDLEGEIVKKLEKNRGRLWQIRDGNIYHVSEA